MRLPLSFVLALSVSTATFAQQSLLRSQVRQRTQNGTTTIDSTLYTHSNGRSTTILPRQRPGELYNSSNGSFMCDSSRLYLKENGQANINGYSTRHFNAAGMVDVLTEEEDTWYGPARKMVITYSYNTAQLPDTITTVLTNTAFNDTRETFAYLGNKLVEQRHQAWNKNQSVWGPPSIDSFIATGGAGTDSLFIRYYSNGSTYTEALRNKYIRNAANHVLIDSLFINGNFSTVTHYFYNTQGRILMDSSAMWKPAQSTMRFAVKHLYNYDANGNLTSTTTMNWHLTDPYYSDIKRDSFSYNNLNQITKQQAYNEAGTSLYPGALSQFYYYYDPTGVAEVATQNTLQLYPVPATSYINLSMQFTKPQTFSVRIFDMQGRLVSNWQEAAQKQYNKQIPLTNMAPGQYTLHICAGDESVSRQFMVVR